MNKEELIKYKWERVFVLCGETFEDYLAIRKAEQEELAALKNEANENLEVPKSRCFLRRIFAAHQKL